MRIDGSNPASVLARSANVSPIKVFSMRVVSFTQARNNLKSVLDQVVADADWTVITRRDSENAVVMSLDHFNGLMETTYLLGSPANASHLDKSIQQYRQGDTVVRALMDD